MTEGAPVYYQDVEKIVDETIARVGKKIVFGMPLGLGKPNTIINAFYRRARQDPGIDLTICTALSLERPAWSSELERRFLEPFVERMFGGYEDLEYMLDLRRKKLPPNVHVKEFYTKAGSILNLRHAQENYISSNYTHAFRDILDSGVNVAGQIVRRGEVDRKTVFSLSCNPEVTLDVVKVMKNWQRDGKNIAIIGEINDNLPFMYGDAIVDPDLFTDVLDVPGKSFRLFGAPKMAITTTDFMIGLHASALIKDEGTLQIGIGSLGDALCYGLQMRHENNEVYRKLLMDTGVLKKFSESIEKIGGVDTFDKGITGSTEMLVDGYLQLVKSGIVKRKTYNNEYIQRLVNEKRLGEKITAESLDALVEIRAVRSRIDRTDFDFLVKWGILKDGLAFENGEIVNGAMRIPADLSDSESKARIVEHCLGTELKNPIIIHGGFFLGPESFYQELNDMTEDERRLIHMTSVLNVNQLYGNEYASQELKVLQRKNGRFVNACLMVCLSGAVVSDGLENGQVVSGVGGQYNFVSQAHALPDGRSILMCKSTRAKGKDVWSNIVWNYGHTTIPRHLRDFVVTEYGIADLRGKSDQEVIAALLNITDSRFQDELLQKAKNAGKIADEYQIPEDFRNNTPDRLEMELKPFRENGFFRPFPYGTDFTPDELVIGKALRGLKEKMAEGLSKVSSLGKAMTIMSVPEAAIPYLNRLQLDAPNTAKEKMMQKLVVYALSQSGPIGSH